MTHPDTLQRAAFEAWAASKHIDITRDGFGGYESQWTEGASEGWQAALQTQAAFTNYPVSPDARTEYASNLVLSVEAFKKAAAEPVSAFVASQEELGAEFSAVLVDVPYEFTTPPATQAALTVALSVLESVEALLTSMDIQHLLVYKDVADAIAQIEALKGPTP